MTYKTLINYIAKHNLEAEKHGCNEWAYYDMVYDLLAIFNEDGKHDYFIDEVTVNESYIALELYNDNRVKVA